MKGLANTREYQKDKHKCKLMGNKLKLAVWDTMADINAVSEKVNKEMYMVQPDWSGMETTESCIMSLVVLVSVQTIP